MVLEEPPARLTLHFSEPVTPVGSGIEIRAPSGKQARSSVATGHGTALSAGFQSTETGTFLVTWRVVSQDTHPSRGQFTFSIGSPGPAAASAQTNELGAVAPAGLALQIVARWLHLAGVALAVGSLVLLLVAPEAEARLLRLAGFGILTLVLAEPLALVAEAISLGAFDAASIGDLLGSGFGRVLGLRIGCALLLWMLIGALRGTALPRSLLLLPPLALVLVDGAAAHLVAGSQPAAIVLNGVHEGAMAIWLGGLAGLLILRLPAPGFARVAAACVGILVVSGGFLAVLHLKRPEDLLLNGYGLVLAVKIVTAGAVFLLAWLASRKLEVLALNAMIGLAAILLSLPPPL